MKRRKERGMCEVDVKENIYSRVSCRSGQQVVIGIEFKCTHSTGNSIA